MGMNGNQDALICNSSEQKQIIYQSQFYKQLIKMRAAREDAFINDRGFRHIKNKEDISGFTYAFWLIRK